MSGMPGAKGMTGVQVMTGTPVTISVPESLEMTDAPEKIVGLQHHRHLTHNLSDQSEQTSYQDEGTA